MSWLWNLFKPKPKVDINKRVLDLAEAEIGVVEWRNGDNPKVLQYFKDSGNSWVGDDETAWCAAFVGAILHRAGLRGTGKLNARSYLDWGKPVDLSQARPGDIVVFSRGDPNGWQGHVNFFLREQKNTIVGLGGNQSNSVNVSAYSKNALLGVRTYP